MSKKEEQIFNFLNEKGIDYEVFEHKPVYTCEKMAKFLKTDQNFIAKSLILKKSDGGYLLTVLPGEMRISYNRLAKIANTKSLSLAPVKEAEEIAGCSIGCVYPFGNLMNLETCFDKKLLKHDYIFFNPGSHIKSVRIKTSDLLRIVGPIIAEFSKQVKH